MLMLKKTVTILLFHAIICFAFAQERRVYYLDITSSMKKNGIWDEVRNNLIRAIDRIDNSTTELIVVPFSDVIKPRKIAFATPEGKRELSQFISSLRYQSDCGTILSNPINDFYNNYIDDSMRTYMFLMTDGREQFYKIRSSEPLSDVIDRWQTSVPENHYGFFVMLHENAYNSKIEHLVSAQQHLWNVKTADININIIEYDNNIIYNTRNEVYSFAKLNQGNIAGLQIDASLKENPYYALDVCHFTGNGIKVSLKKKSAHIPDKYTVELILTCPSLPEYSYIVTDRINIHCIDKKEKSLILRFK